MNTQALDALDKICPSPMITSSDAQVYLEKTGVPPRGWKLVTSKDFHGGKLYLGGSAWAYGNASHFLVRNDW